MLTALMIPAPAPEEAMVSAQVVPSLRLKCLGVFWQQFSCAEWNIPPGTVSIFSLGGSLQHMMCGLI